MRKRIETFEKKNNDKKDFKIIRRLVHEEEFVLTEEVLDRLERNANAEIDRANSLILEMQEKLKECAKLRKILEK
jgi:hypothetical protein